MLAGLVLAIVFTMVTLIGAMAGFICAQLIFR